MQKGTARRYQIQEPSMRDCYIRQAFPLLSAPRGHTDSAGRKCIGRYDPYVVLSLEAGA